LSTLALLALGLALMAHARFLPVSLPILAVWLTLPGRAGYEAADRLRQRRWLRAALAGYLGPQVLEEVLAGRLSPAFEGRRYLVCGMFVDMRDFTPRSEAMDPEQLVQLLNRWFEELVACVHQHGGTVEKFLGDGLMAFFGAPNPLSNPSRVALTAAKEMFHRMESLNVRLEAEGLAPIRIGVGLNAGRTVVAHVGSRSRHDYTTIGDVVTVASRLEGLTKDTGYPLVCSASVAEQVGDDAGLTPLGERAVKGHSPMAVFGWRPERHEPKQGATAIAGGAR
jgi:class 3 adenylate cyclase